MEGYIVGMHLSTLATYFGQTVLGSFLKYTIYATVLLNQYG